MSLLKLASKKAARSPARQELAERINTITGLHRAVKQAEMVVERAQSLRDQAAQHFDAASAAASEAREGHAAAMLESARTGNPVATAATTRDLRHAASDAKDDLDATEAALASAVAERDEAQTNRDRVGRDIVRARDLVLAEALPELLAEAEKQLDGLFHTCGLLMFLNRGQPQNLRASCLAENIREMLARQTGRRLEFPKTAEMEEALTALLSNPDVPLPGIAS